MPTDVRSYAKINLGLRIGTPRSDGFHELSTVYQTVDLYDRVTITAAPADRTSIAIACSDQRVPCTPQNTAWKAVQLALEAMALHASVSITIEKRLPVQGGLGAGSANAIAALLGLERELAHHNPQEPLTSEQRLVIAEQIGSDVPLFAIGGTVFGQSRGEQVLPLPDSPELPCVIAVPNLAVSTPQAFRDWDALIAAPGSAAALTQPPTPGRIKEFGRSVAAAWAHEGRSGVFSAGEGLAEDPVLALVRTGIENDFEQVVFPQHPLLRDLKAALAGDSPGIPPTEKAPAAMLSGSGAALFGLYANPAAAKSAVQRVEALGAKAICTSTISRSRYWQEMFEK